jgi:hypothetical protein
MSDFVNSALVLLPNHISSFESDRYSFTFVSGFNLSPDINLKKFLPHQAISCSHAGLVFSVPKGFAFFVEGGLWADRPSRAFNLIFLPS